jgi:hypothetical protein
MSNTVSFHDVTVLGETQLALKCEVEGEVMWIPKSQIADESEVYKLDTEGELVITEWFAEKEGLS